MGTQNKEANRRHQRAFRDRRRGGPPRQPKPCGHYAAYRRHKINDEPIDDACREAYNRYQSINRFLRIAREKYEEATKRSERRELKREIRRLEGELDKVR